MRGKRGWKTVGVSLSEFLLSEEHAHLVLGLVGELVVAQGIVCGTAHVLLDQGVFSEEDLLALDELLHVVVHLSVCRQEVDESKVVGLDGSDGASKDKGSECGFRILLNRLFFIIIN